MADLKDYLNEESWNSLLNEEFKAPYFKDLEKFVKGQYKSKEIYPPKEQIFAALNFSSFNDVKVVILGQDPYHGEKQANGLSFSVSEEVKIPPSLRNIYKELNDDIGCKIPLNGDLSHWAKQGVLLLNATLTVEKANAGSHQKKGWEQFTDKIIELISSHRENVVFILWGAYAQKKIKLIDLDKHHIISSNHPSPLSAYRGFFGSKPFSKTNDFLKKHKIKEINWCL